MPEVSEFQNIPANASIDDIRNIVSKMQKELYFLMQNIDSFNVTELNTNVTNISSADGETVINGPLLEQYDSNGTLRIKQGLDIETNDFIFNMYDDLGNESIYLNSSGEAVFAGNVKTLKDAYVGYNIYLGDNFDQLTTREINIASGNGINSQIMWSADIGINESNYSDMGISLRLFDDGMSYFTDNMAVSWVEGALYTGQGIKFDITDNFYVYAGGKALINPEGVVILGLNSYLDSEYDENLIARKYDIDQSETTYNGSHRHGMPDGAQVYWYDPVTDQTYTSEFYDDGEHWHGVELTT